MEEILANFPNQLTHELQIENGAKLTPRDKFIVAGMGGSALGALLLKLAERKLDLLIHRDYGLPRAPDYFLQQSLIILISYSGNTEEVLSVGEEAKKANLALAVISTGGKLLEFAQANQLPFIKLPDWELPPRLATGLIVRALAALMGNEANLTKLSELGAVLQPQAYQQAGEALARQLAGRVPMIYSSTANLALAYNWKIKFNETSKVAAFYNVLPEQNHNEISAVTPALNLTPIFLEDDTDHTRIIKRFAVLKELLVKRGLPVETVKLSGASVWEKIFTNLLLADWCTYYLAKNYGVDPLPVPVIEEFKGLMS